MAKVFLITTTPHESGAYEQLLAAVPQDHYKVHSLAGDAASAELIIFVESWNADAYGGALRRHPLVRQFREKCFCFNELPGSLPVLPGVYTWAPRRFYRSSRVRTGGYIAMMLNTYVGFCPGIETAPYLYQFVGSRDTWPLRSQLLELADERAHLVDTTAEATRMRAGTGIVGEAEFRARYAEQLRLTKFVLCPRGVSPSSIRLFETMQAGRVPVIISDEWVPPVGPDWNSFSVTVSERDAMNLPRILREAEPRATQMGTEARRNWEQWFSREAWFHSLTEWCLQLHSERRYPESVMRFDALRCFLSLDVFKGYLRNRAPRLARAARAMQSISPRPNRHVQSI